MKSLPSPDLYCGCRPRRLQRARPDSVVSPGWVFVESVIIRSRSNTTAYSNSARPLPRRSSAPPAKTSKQSSPKIAVSRAMGSARRPAELGRPSHGYKRARDACVARPRTLRPVATFNAGTWGLDHQRRKAGDDRQLRPTEPRHTCQGWRVCAATGRGISWLWTTLQVGHRVRQRPSAAERDQDSHDQKCG